MSNSGVWIWYVNKLRADYLERLQLRGCKRVYLKVLDDASQGVFWDSNCTSDVIKGFTDHGIDVWGWGYVFDNRKKTDVDAITNAIKLSIERGCKGFVFDVEHEVEDPSTHKQLEDLLKAAKNIVPAGNLGYTSFGVPEFHPNVPWKMLNQRCDIQFPQMYFELWGFAGSNKDEVDRAFKSHKNLGLDKPILPVWSSEPNPSKPASVDELNEYLKKYPGSSIWRAPNVGEKGFAFELTYGSAGVGLVNAPELLVAKPALVGRVYKPAPLPLGIDRVLKLGKEGEDVYVLRRALIGLGFLKKEETVSTVFDPKLEKAVLAYQAAIGVGKDGKAGPITLAALEMSLTHARRKLTRAFSGAWNGKDFAAFAEDELMGNVNWHSTLKFVQPWKDIFPGWWNWCGATQYWLLNEFLYAPNGKTLALKEQGMQATFALVEAWQDWGRRKGWYVDNNKTFEPPPGAFLIFDWEQISLDEPDNLSIEDHIGCFLRKESNDVFVSAEGNTDSSIVPKGRTAIKRRNRKTIQGYVIVPEGFRP